MKIRYKSILAVLVLGVVFASCDKDNYAEPKTFLTGNIVYQGEPIGVEHDQVRMQLWQPGFGKLAPIDVYVAQDGSYSSLLFDGNYKLVMLPSEGPWKTIVKDAVAKDTIFINLNGDQQVDVEVMPYYTFSSANFTSEPKRVSATAALNKVITGADAKDIERVSLIVSKTRFVSRANNVAIKNMSGADVKDIKNISLSVDVPTISPAQDVIFARVGVKIKGVEDMLFSKVEQLNNN